MWTREYLKSFFPSRARKEAVRLLGYDNRSLTVAARFVVILARHTPRVSDSGTSLGRAAKVRRCDGKMIVD